MCVWLCVVSVGNKTVIILIILRVDGEKKCDIKVFFYCKSSSRLDNIFGDKFMLFVALVRVRLE